MLFLAALLLAAAPETEVKLQPVRLDAPCWSWLAPALAPLKEGEVRLGSATLTVAEKDKSLLVSLGDKSASPGAKPAFLGNGLGAVGLLKGAPPCFGKEEPAQAFAFLAGALEGKAAGQALRFLDLDGNGSALDFGKDGVLYPGCRCIVPFETRMVVGRSAVAFSVREGKLFAAESAQPPPAGGETEMAVLQIWNDYRIGAGLPALELDPALCDAATAHARYLSKNPDIWPSPTLDSHDEDPKRPGFSLEGQASARRSCLATAGSGRAGGIGSNDLKNHLNGWLTNLYHKPPVLIPGCRKAGICGRFGYDVVDGQGLNDQDGLSWPHPLAFPAPWQATPFRSIPDEEIPNPMPSGTTQGAGASILLYFGDSPSSSKVQGTLCRIEAGKGKEVEAFLSSPEKPANAAIPHNQYCICLIPKQPLKPLSEYEVDLRYVLEGKPCRAFWRFFTGK